MFISVVSSHSSQLGSYFTIDHLLKNKAPFLFGYSFILFCRFPTRSMSAKGLYVDCHYLKISHKVICIDFFVESIWSKLLFACIYIIFSGLSYLIDSLILIEPRPFWAYQALSSFPLHQKLPYFRNIFLSGDGFLALTLASSPPWLSLSSSIKQNLNKRYMNHIKGGLYLYSTSRDAIASSKFKKADPTSIIYLLQMYCKQSYSSMFCELYDSIDVSIKCFPPAVHSLNVVIFPMTTFSETARCSLEDEINMYVNFLVGIFSDVRFSNCHLLIKPHPGQSFSKSNRLLSRLQALSIIKLHPLSFSRQSLLGSIPLEILVMHLRDKGCDYIALISASTSAVPISLLFKDFVSFLPAFGRPFLEKLLNDDHLDSRLKQEQLIHSLLSPKQS